MKSKYICTDCAQEFSSSEYQQQSDIFCSECGGHIEEITKDTESQSSIQSHELKTSLEIIDATTQSYLIPCEYCNHEFSRRAKECPKCGQKPKIFCQICQQKIPYDSITCSECGDPEPFQIQPITNSNNQAISINKNKYSKLVPNGNKTEPYTTKTSEIKSTSVFVVILLTIITAGLYYPIWFLTRRDAINTLESDEKLGKGVFIFGIVGFSLSLLAAMASGFFEGISEGMKNPAFMSYAKGLDGIDTIISLVVGLTLLFQCFKVKAIFHHHYNVEHGKNIKFSGIMIFFFQIYYLQYKINRFD